MITLLLALACATTVSEHPVGERPTLGLVFRAPDLEPQLRNRLAGELREVIEDSTLFRMEDLTDLATVAEDPLVALIRALQARGTKVPELVVLLAVLPGSAADQMLVGRQLLLADKAARSGADWVEGSVVSGDPSAFLVASGLDEMPSAALPDLVKQVILPELRRELESRDLWHPQGNLRLEFQGAGFDVVIDDRTVASGVEGPITVDHMTAGERRVTLRHPNYRSVESTVVVKPGERATYTPVLISLLVEEAAVPRRVVAITGAGLVTAGAVFLTMALVRAGDATPGCIVLADGGGCAPTSDRFARVGGLPAAPLGYSLITAGAIMGVSVWATAPETQPWWYALLGVGVGALAFGVSLWAE